MRTSFSEKQTNKQKILEHKNPVRDYRSHIHSPLNQEAAEYPTPNDKRQVQSPITSRGTYENKILLYG